MFISTNIQNAKSASRTVVMMSAMIAASLSGTNAFANCGTSHADQNVCRSQDHSATNSSHAAHHTTYRTNQHTGNTGSLLGTYAGHSQWSSNSGIPSTYSSYGSSNGASNGSSYGSTYGASHGTGYGGSGGYSNTSSYGGTISNQEANVRYGSGTISRTYSDGPARVIPFSTASHNIGSYRLPGLGANEYLTATHCPVDVHNPNGGTVLGCYKVAKRTIVTRHVHIPKITRVVRPIIYVRYPVPVPVPFPVYHHNGGGYSHNSGYHNSGYGNSGYGNSGYGSSSYQCGSNSRYGANWPGRSFCR